MASPAQYLQVAPGAASLPVVGSAPFRALIIAEHQVDPRWQGKVAKWLVRSGCLFMMAWGLDASSWDDAVDIANIKESGLERIPEDRFVITTWHDRESLAEVLWFARTCAVHSVVGLNYTVLLHIGSTDREQELLALYEKEWA